MHSEIDKLAVTTIRTLAMDGVQKANSGHPGAPLGMAPAAYCLWQQFFRYDPADPLWPNRDRFVLSAGHASMLLYALLHLSEVRDVTAEGKVGEGPAVPLEELKRFRQMGSRCPGHPEFGLTAGVETTTGPLGQGVSVSVGMAMAGRWLASHFNRPGFDLFGFRVWALCGDGDLMEGVASEAASLAGHHRLENLVWIYDSNRITIEGSTDLAFTEDVAGRFRAYGWQVLGVDDGNDLDALAESCRVAMAGSGRPTLIVVRSHIAYGAPHKQDTASAHGEPLGEEEIRLTKRAYGWPEEAAFFVPEPVREHFREGLGRRGRELRQEWQRRWEGYQAQHPELARQLAVMWQRRLPEGWDLELPVYPPDPKGKATREISGKILNLLAGRVPWLIGGSADLAPSTKTRIVAEGAGDLDAGHPGGRNLHFGVREHAMAALVNGLAHCHLRPYGATFLVFSDYNRPSIRLASMMELPVIHIFTHDSIGVGEDGPTHQPVEHLAALRAIPGLIVLRPGDANEVVEAWRVIMRLRREPVALVLTRQNLPTLDRQGLGHPGGLARGAYVLREASGGLPEVLLLGSGSEVSLCLEAAGLLEAQGVPARVVSMPSWELFERQDSAYRDSVLPPRVTVRLAVEQAIRQGWDRYVGPAGDCVCLKGFGASAPHEELRQHFGFTPEKVAATALRLLKRG